MVKMSRAGTRRQAGYVALLTVLVVGAAATAIALVLLTSGVNSQRSTLIEQQSKQSRGLAVACAEEALQLIHDNIAFSGTNTLTLGQGTCIYTVSVTAATTRSVVVSGTVGNVVKKIQLSVTIGTSSISITSWQEVS
jgi:type II secretory pathway component PulK